MDETIRYSAEEAAGQFRAGMVRKASIESYYDTARHALEKQIPREPTAIRKSDRSFACPSCGKRIRPTDPCKEYRYCPSCGQKLIWNEEVVKWLTDPCKE